MMRSVVGFLYGMLLFCPFVYARPLFSITSPILVPQVFQTQDWPEDEIDSLAVWRKEGEQPLLFITGKRTDQIYICDAATGTLVNTLGSPGGEPGQLKRPNGIAVFKDYLIVVERDNHRIQIFNLPELQSVLIFGEEQLKYPYGVAVVPTGQGADFFITDNYPVIQRKQFQERIKQYRLSVQENNLQAEFIKAFGAQDGAGRLDFVESITADPEKEKIFICDETAHAIKVYNLQGEFTGQSFGQDVIVGDAEGIDFVFQASAPQGGWLLLSDQNPNLTQMQVFSRDGSTHLGTFSGDPVLANTDGIRVEEGSYGPFREAAIYAIHDDSRVQGYSWKAISDALKLERTAILMCE